VVEGKGIVENLKFKKKYVMKKVALAILVLGVVAAGVVGWRVWSKPVVPVVEEEEEVAVELPPGKRPFVLMRPRADGHEIKLQVSRILIETPVLEYELVYQVADGRTLGVPGTVKLFGKTSLERDLLLGSCSSGKCRYDEGVETGSLTVKLRDGKGKLIGKAETPFHLGQGGDGIGLGGWEFSGSLDGKSFYLAYENLGLPEEVTGEVMGGPFSVGTAGSTKVKGKVSFQGEGVGEGSQIWAWKEGGWKELVTEVVGDKVTAEVASLGTWVVK